MAQRTQVFLIDDLDGGEAVETVRFGVDGQSYQIDLSAANSAGLREALAPFVTAARREPPTSQLGRVRRAVASSEQTPPDVNRKVRDWAALHKVPLSEKGRVPRTVVQAWRDGRPDLAHEWAAAKRPSARTRQA